MVVNIIKELISLGFSEYEAKAYIGLLKNIMPSTAYEVAKGTGIPTSKIYEVLEKLIEKQVVLVLEDKGKKRYSPLEPNEFLNDYKMKFDSSIKKLGNDLESIRNTKNVAFIWNFKEYDYFINKAEKMILNATHELLISSWKEEISMLEKALIKAKADKVKISIIHFGEPDIKTGQIFQHPIEDTIYSEKGGRGFVLVADGKEAIMATVLNGQPIEGAWSINKGFVTLAEDYIKHDVYIMKIVKRFNQLLIDKFGPNYLKLRDVFTDQEV